MLEGLTVLLRATYAMRLPDQVRIALHLGILMEQVENETGPSARGSELDGIFSKWLLALREQQRAGLAHADEALGAVEISAAKLCEYWLLFKPGNLSGGRKTYDAVTESLHAFISHAIGDGR